MTTPAAVAEDLQQARRAFACGDLGQARKALTALRERHPADPAVLVARADLHLTDREPEEALVLLDQASALQPRSAEVLDARARCLHVLERNAEAITVGEEAHALLGEGDNYRYASSVYLTLVWCYRDLGRFREALTIAEEGLARVPDAVLAHWASVVEDEIAESEKEGC